MKKYYSYLKILSLMPSFWFCVVFSLTGVLGIVLSWSIFIWLFFLILAGIFYSITKFKFDILKSIYGNFLSYDFLKQLGSLPNEEMNEKINSYVNDFIRKTLKEEENNKDDEDDNILKYFENDQEDENEISDIKNKEDKKENGK